MKLYRTSGALWNMDYDTWVAPTPILFRLYKAFLEHFFLNTSLKTRFYESLLH